MHVSSAPTVCNRGVLAADGCRGIQTDRTEHAYASAQEYKEALEAIRRHTGAERSKPQRTLEAQPKETQEELEHQFLEETLVPEPWELNNTARASVELLFFNRVPKVGSQTFMELLRRLSLMNQFGTLLIRDLMIELCLCKKCVFMQFLYLHTVRTHIPHKPINHYHHTTLTRFRNQPELIFRATQPFIMLPDVRLFNLTSRQCSGDGERAAEVVKKRKYSGLDAGYNFIAFGVETLGPWGPGARELFSQLAKRLVDATGDKRAGSFLAQRLGIAIQRGNAASILGTMPQGPFLDLY
ncbi:hypothetical protein MSG28_005108 [Choristoneura fumiferana]|uniref:Uncharacterized protein n=1 Tax=Choristoneura fumiferana TaxID=7141 RepID=A0ACC0JQ85_CHOFU|nr:hypothetical protein MSG28_005108 [Choristoneura fumiferana]